MSTSASGSVTPRQRHRAQTRAEILDAALAVMTEEGVAALNLSEVAKRVGLRQPSLYQYFESRTAVYDALFERGMQTHLDIVTGALAGAPNGWAAVSAAMKATLAFAIERPALAQLLFTRAVPGFVPSSRAYAPSLAVYDKVSQAVTVAIKRGQLHPTAASERGVALLFSLVAGVFSQHLANDPAPASADHQVSELLASALDMYCCYFAPDRPKAWTP